MFGLWASSEEQQHERKKALEERFDHVLSERLLFIVRDSISLSPLDEAEWHAWRHAAGCTVPRRLSVTVNHVKPQSGLV